MTHSPSRAPACALAALFAAAAVMTGCVEERIISIRGGLHGLQGAETPLKMEAKQKGELGTTWDALLTEYYPPESTGEAGEAAPGFPNRKILPDGSYVLLSRSPRDLIVHLYETLVAGEYDLMYSQLISQRTKDAYLEQGLDPEDAGRYLVRNRTAVIKFLQLMPAAEATPGVFMAATKRKSYELRVSNAQAVSSKYSKLECAIEDGRFVLVMID